MTNAETWGELGPAMKKLNQRQQDFVRALVTCLTRVMLAPFSPYSTELIRPPRSIRSTFCTVSKTLTASRAHAAKIAK